MAASLRFLAQNDLELLDRFQFDVLPCLNPFGFLRNFRNYRENVDGIDINRTFDDLSTVEAKIVRSFLVGRQYDLFVEFHEDWAYDGFYLFELSQNYKSIDEKITATVSQVAKLHRNALLKLATRRSCLRTSDSTYNSPRSPLLEESNTPTKLEFK